MKHTNDLLLVDIQNDYFTDGLRPVDEIDRVAEQAQNVLQAARSAGDLGYRVSVVAGTCGAPAKEFADVRLSGPQVQAAFLKPLEMSYARII